MAASTSKLALWDPDTGKFLPVSEEQPFEVEDFALSPDGDKVAYATNEDGRSVLRLLGLKLPISFSSFEDQPGVVGERIVSVPPPEIAGLPEVILRFVPDSQPVGVFSGLKWTPPLTTGPTGGGTVAFNVSNAETPADVYAYTYDSSKGEFGPYVPKTRYTRSETGGLPPYAFARERLVKWKSFDDREISGFLYAPDARKFPGKRPVIVNIHGGPEAQYRPGFLGRNNYLINELGCAMIFPNVRGSSGYGKTFVGLDNGFQREDKLQGHRRAAGLDQDAAGPRRRPHQ